MEDSPMINQEGGTTLDNSSSEIKYDYDLFVIGGGSGGLACAKTAQELGAKVAVADYVNPTPKGTKWGIGGTCVNVGCIPKKMMHYSALLGEKYHDHPSTGWVHENAPKHDWNKMIENINDHIRGINYGYRKDLAKRGIDNFNEFASFIDEHTIELKGGPKKIVHQVTAKYIVIAVGGRPSYPDIPGAKEYGITSDDIAIWLHKTHQNPGTTLVVGASYVALECAGFLHAFGNHVSVMVRSIFLRGFDQQIASMIAEDMENSGVNFIKDSVPTRLEKNEKTGKIICYYQTGDDENIIEVDTVLFAIGRYAITEELNLKNAGVKAENNGKFKANKFQQTNVSHIYAIGDVLYGKLELTPTAIHCGKLLARRLFAGGKTLMNFYDVPTTVFTPLEYGSVGYSEEDAITEFESFVKVYHTYFTPLEWQFDKARSAKRNCYVKVIVNTADDNKVIGFHILCPNAGEVTQTIGVAIKCGLTKDLLDECIGIHPTIAEEVTNLHISKDDDANPVKSSCCS